MPAYDFMFYNGLQRLGWWGAGCLHLALVVRVTMFGVVGCRVLSLGAYIFALCIGCGLG